MATKEYFTGLKKIVYNPNAKIDETMVYKHYNADEIIMGRKMSEWLRFSVCAWHTFVWVINNLKCF
jgi:xylose isomerase